MAMTVEEILAHVRELSSDEQARLRAALVSAESLGEEYLPISPEVKQMLTGHAAEEFIILPTGTTEDARALLRSWNEGAAVELDEGDGTWDDMLRDLDAHRSSPRLLFPELAREQ